MVISDEINNKLPVSWRSFLLEMVVALVLSALIWALLTNPTLVSDMSKVFFWMCGFTPFFLLLCASLFRFVLPMWWRNNHDGWVMIITRKEHKLLNDDKLADAIVYIIGYKRLSEFRRAPRRAYDDAILVAMNPKCLQVHFEDGHGVIDFHFRAHGDWGRIVTRGAGVKFTFSEPERLWEFVKENPYASHMDSAESIMNKLRELDEGREYFANLLLVVEEHLADVKRFGRSVGAPDLRWMILELFESPHALPLGVVERFEERIRAFNASTKGKKMARKGVINEAAVSA